MVDATSPIVTMGLTTEKEKIVVVASAGETLMANRRKSSVGGLLLSNLNIPQTPALLLLRS